MSRENRTCAMCAKFSTKDNPQQAAAGLGLCLGFPAEVPRDKFVEFFEPACVLFDKAKDRQEVAARQRYVEKMMTKEGA